MALTRVRALFNRARRADIAPVHGPGPDRHSSRRSLTSNVLLAILLAAVVVGWLVLR